MAWASRDRRSETVTSLSELLRVLDTGGSQGYRLLSQRRLGEGTHLITSLSIGNMYVIDKDYTNTYTSTVFRDDTAYAGYGPRPLVIQGVAWVRLV